MSPPSFRVAREAPARAKVLGVPVFSDLSTPPGAGAEIEKGYLVQRRFEGKPGQAQAIPASDGTTVVALGLGARSGVDTDVMRRAGAALARNAGNATTIATGVSAATGSPSLVAAHVEGIGLAGYRFEAARKVDGHPTIGQVVVVDADGAGPGSPVREAVRRGSAAVEATWRARDWVNLPPRDLTPTELAMRAVESADGLPVAIDVWDERRIQDERLGGLMGVASGAAEPPRLIRLEYSPPGAEATVALVGKGITFDSGGLSLKTAAGMMWMKADMGGAAAVISATLAAASLGAPTRVVGWVAATENMPGGRAIHPGDVLVARNGTSIEVLNTDAEGRLVLADALSLAAEEEPDAMIDVATLTGGQRVALGASVAAVMGTDTDLVRRVVDAGRSAGEPAWELPLYAPYRKQLDSEVADLRNVTGDTAASSIMAALFLQEFTGGRRWAHLDIAGPSWTESDEGWLRKGGTGWGTRTLLELLLAWPSGSGSGCSGTDGSGSGGSGSGG